MVKDGKNDAIQYRSKDEMKNAYLKNYKMGRNYFLEGEDEKAINYYKKALAIQPDNEQVITALGTVYKKMGNFSVAKKYFDEAIYINPRYYIAYLQRGSLNYEKGYLDLVIQDMTKAIRFKPDNHDDGVLLPAYAMRGATNYEIKDYDKAYVDLDKATRLNPKANHLLFLRAESLRLTNRCEVAIEGYERAIDGYSSEKLNDRELKEVALAHVNRGICYSTLNRPDSALKDYEMSIKINPDNGYPYNNIGYYYSVLKEYDKALKYLNKAINIDSKVALFYVNRGNTYYELKKNEEMCIDYDKACKLGNCKNIKWAKKYNLCEKN